MGKTYSPLGVHANLDRKHANCVAHTTKPALTSQNTTKFSTLEEKFGSSPGPWLHDVLPPQTVLPIEKSLSGCAGVYLVVRGGVNTPFHPLLLSQLTFNWKTKKKYRFYCPQGVQPWNQTHVLEFGYLGVLKFSECPTCAYGT